MLTASTVGIMKPAHVPHMFHQRNGHESQCVHSDVWGGLHVCTIHTHTCTCMCIGNKNLHMYTNINYIIFMLLMDVYIT